MKRAAPNDTPSGPALNEELCQCAVCLEVMFTKIVTCPEGHGIRAETCHAQLPSPKRCPQCRKAYGSTPPRGVMVEQIIASCDWSCKYGCGLTMKGSGMADHLSKCAKRAVKCPKCDATMPLASFGQHFGETRGDTIHLSKLAQKQDASKLELHELQACLAQWGLPSNGNKATLMRRFAYTSPWTTKSLVTLDTCNSRFTSRFVLEGWDEMFTISCLPNKGCLHLRVFHCDLPRRCMIRIGNDSKKPLWTLDSISTSYADYMLWSRRATGLPNPSKLSDPWNELVFSFETGKYLFTNEGSIAIHVAIFPS